MKKNLLIVTALSIAVMAGATDSHKKILVEEFTGEGCTNCPRAATITHGLLEDEAYAEDVIVVCHHSGYKEDWLTTDFDKAYTWFYNASSTYAPGMMADRYAAEGEKSPVFTVPNTETVQQHWDTALAIPATVGLDLSSELSSDGKTLKVRVIGQKNVRFSMEDPRLTIWLVENDIEAIYQVGAGAGYIHQHVGRAVNETWGAQVEFDGDWFVYDYEFDMSFMWYAPNMYVVATFGNYDAENPCNCVADNTTALYHKDWKGLNEFTGIMGLNAGKDKAAAYYTLSGTCLDARPTAAGIYIEKTAAGSRKIAIR